MTVDTEPLNIEKMRAKSNPRKGPPEIHLINSTHFPLYQILTWSILTSSWSIALISRCTSSLPGLFLRAPGQQHSFPAVPDPYLVYSYELLVNSTHFPLYQLLTWSILTSSWSTALISRCTRSLPGLFLRAPGQ